MTIIDAHTHAYTERDLESIQVKMAVLDGPLSPDSPHRWQLTHRGDLKTLVETETAAGVERLILLPVAGRPERVEELNRWSARAAEDHPQIIPFATLHPASPDPAADLALALDLGLKGVKLHTLLQRFSLLDRPALDLAETLAKAGLPVLLDTLHGPGLMKVKPHLAAFGEEMEPFAAAPGQIARWAALFPELTIIAAHLGCLYGWEEVGPLLEPDNVYFDLAFVDRLLGPARARELIRAKGAGRVLWGTDAPWREAGPALAWLRELELTPEEEAAVAGLNAARLLNL